MAPQPAQFSQPPDHGRHHLHARRGVLRLRYWLPGVYPPGGRHRIPEDVHLLAHITHIRHNTGGDWL